MVMMADSKHVGTLALANKVLEMIIWMSLSGCAHSLSPWMLAEQVVQSSAYACGYCRLWCSCGRGVVLIAGGLWCVVSALK